MIKSRIFTKYFISYVVLLVAVFGVLTSVFAYVISYTRNEIETSVLNNFRQIGIFFEDKINELKSMADLMCQNENLTHFRLSNTNYTSISGIKELKRIGVSNSFIYDVLVCYDNYIYSTNGKAFVDVYTNDFLYLDSESSIIAKKAILNSSKTGFYELYTSGINNTQSKYMLCTYPIKSLDSPIGTFGFIVSEDTIKKTLNNHLDKYGVGVRMLLPSGEVFTEINQSSTEELFNEGYIDSYLYYSYTIDSINFSFDIAIDSVSAFSYIRKLQRISYMIILLIFASSLLLSYIFSKKHYKPIKMISKEIKANLWSNNANEAENEFDVILKAINIAQLNSKMLSQKLDESNFILRQQALALLFSGAFRNVVHIKNLMQLIGINVEEPNFSVVIAFQYKNNGKNENMPGIEALYDLGLKGYYLTSIMDTSAVVFIAELNDFDLSRKKRKRIASGVQKYFESIGKVCGGVCFGCVYDDIGLISTSYREAIICAEKYIIFSDKISSPVFYESLSQTNGDGYYFDSHDIERLLKNLDKKDLVKSTECFEKIMEKLSKKNLSPDLQMFHHYDLLHQLFHFFRKDTVGAHIAEMVRVDCCSAEEFSEQMKTLFRFICNKSVQKVQTNVFNSIIEYIDDNYANSDISIEFLARKFHISLNYFSKYFKEKTGENYIKYLSRLRMEKAFHLIKDTDMPIKEIVLKVGYIDTVNFTKKFKKTYHCLPSELRMNENDKLIQIEVHD